MWKTYPENPDAWCETLTPIEGAWSVESGILRLSSFRAVGNYSIENDLTTPQYRGRIWFALFNGKEFDGLKTYAKLHFKLALENEEWEIVGDWSDGVVILYDFVGKTARRQFSQLVDSNFYDWTFNLGPGMGWDEEAGFNWRLIKAVELWLITTTKAGGRRGEGSIWVDKLHFSYYEVVPAKLTILSVPSGKNFKIDTAFMTTPQTLSITPNMTYEVSMEPTNFDHWENGDRSPVRTFTLAEGQEYTATAYYKEVPPPPPVSLTLPALLGLCGIFIVAGIIIYRKAK